MSKSYLMRWGRRCGGMSLFLKRMREAHIQAGDTVEPIIDQKTGKETGFTVKMKEEPSP